MVYVPATLQIIDHFTDNYFTAHMTQPTVS